MKKIRISSPHSKYVAGAIALVKEVEQARILTNEIGKTFNELYPGVGHAAVWHDNTSKTQKANIAAINKWHHSEYADRHYSIHLNSSGATTARDIGIEVLYAYNRDKPHATQLANNISKETGLKNRGAKQRTDLGFLNKPGKLLIEAYFVNSENDVKKMDEQKEIESFAKAVALTIGVELGLSVIQPIKYRIKSGRYNSKENMVKAVERIDYLKIASKKWIQTYNVGNEHYFLTGVYNSKMDAEKAIDLMKAYKILSNAHIVKA